MSGLDNSDVNYISEPVGNLLTLGSGNPSFSYVIDNPTLGTQILFYDFTPEGNGLDYPEATEIDDKCLGQVGKERSCNINISFDADRFHFGVMFTKQISFNSQVVDLEFTGNSPCSDSGDALYNPGTKLNESKTACVPNLGVFDAKDSVFGHTVFQ